VHEGASQSDGRSMLDPAVAVLITDAADAERLSLTLRDVLATTSPHVPVVIHGGKRPQLAADDVAGREISYADERAGSVPGLTAERDLVILEAGVSLPSGWLSVLAEVAHAGPGTATVSPMRADAALERSALTLDVAAATVATEALMLHPRLGTGGCPCLYVRRTALELADWTGSLTERTERAAFLVLCLEAGLTHVLADELLVDGRRARLPDDPQEREAEAVRRAVGVARRALVGLEVVIDGRVPSGRRDGTWVHVLELIAALGRTDGARVKVIVPDRPDPDLRKRLGATPGIILMTLSSAQASGDELGDVVHRPFQVSAPADLASLASLAPRLVITHQDLISFHSASYFPSRQAWAGYRDLTRRALSAADHVVFFSEFVRRGALEEGLVEAHRGSVVPLGVDHAVSTDPGPGAAPAPVASISAEAEVMLCLGTDFRHKNRMFALRVLGQLHHRHGWAGWLVLAGPKVAHGSSAAEEQAFLAAHPEVAERVLDLGPVPGPEKEWLLRRAGLVLYPTLEEGFGLIPFEAAARGTPCLWAASGALGEVLPPESALVVPWDAAATADQARTVLHDPRLQGRLIDAVQASAGTLRWDATARRLVGLYREIGRQPPAPTAALERAGGVMTGGISDDAVRLVGPGGLLPRAMERPLLALASHRRLAGPVFGLIRTGYRASRLAARLRGAAQRD